MPGHPRYRAGRLATNPVFGMGGECAHGPRVSPRAAASFGASRCGDFRSVIEATTVSVIASNARSRNELQLISADYNPGEEEEKALTITLDNESIPRKFAHYEKEHSRWAAVSVVLLSIA